MQKYRITQQEINENNVKSAADLLRGNAQSNKNVFDKLPELIAERLNKVIDNVYSKLQVDSLINNKIVEIGSADMAKAIYDKNNDGIVDKADLALDSEKLGGKASNEYALEDETVKKSGGTMTGALTLHANPTANMHAASKQYVDNLHKMDLLWENASPSSAFPEQTISLDLSKYSVVVISCKVKDSSPTAKHWSFVLVDGEDGRIISPSETIAQRIVTVTTEGITFEKGKIWSGGSSAETSNVYCIPLQIYGIK